MVIAVVFRDKSFKMVQEEEARQICSDISRKREIEDILTTNEGLKAELRRLIEED